MDTNAAWGMAIDFDDPCVAIIKHTNPAGLAVAPTLAQAYPKSLAGDPVSAFGGIVAANRPIDVATAQQIVEVFTEVVIAPGYEAGALEVLQTKKNLRILAMPNAQRPTGGWDVRSVMGGVLVQHSDVGDEPFEEWTVVTEKQPTPEELEDLKFAWIAAKHVKSNAIVLVKDKAVVGVGAGQMSRIDSTKIAADKSGGRVKGAVLASDAFFPFRDGPDAAIDFGVTAIVQPGGSIRDQEVFDAANERGIVMITTGRRHFRH
ncbi:MAG: phosphoribosylaminoimidazolecarboxamide formyltransferase/IMP cyclohydrolase [Glaciecola sp.]